MKPVLSFVKLDLNNAVDSAFFESLYLQSFPPDERRDWVLVKTLAEQNGLFSSYLILSDEKRVGFITFWTLDDFIYVEHFAVDPGLRGGGIGFNAMRKFAEEVEKPIVLEVEKPDEEMAKRRIGFYQRLGYTLHPHYYMQPAYGPGKSPLEMQLMTLEFEHFCNSFDRVVNYIYHNVYGK